MPRPRNKRPVSQAITASTDGRWHGFVTVGVKANGQPERRHRTSVMCPRCKGTPTVGCECYQRCEDKVRELEDALSKGAPVPKGRIQNLAQYLPGWLEGRTDLKYGTRTYYSTAMRCYLVPAMGHLRLDALVQDPGHITRGLKKIEDDHGIKASKKALATLRSALTDAVRAKKIPMNPAKGDWVRPPKPPAAAEIVPFTVDEAMRILAVAECRRCWARWAVAVAHGHRQGEALALAWRRADKPRQPGDVDLDAGTITVREKLERRKWLHGCDDPHACGAAPRKSRPDGLHRFTACQPAARGPRKGACPIHRGVRGCPPPCKRGCTEHAASCPKRRGGGLVIDEPKSEAAKRTAPMHPMVWEAFRLRKAEQDAERDLVGSKWVDTGLIFTTRFGRPMDPRRDWDEWRSILVEAGVAMARLHDARHTAATLLLMQGVTGREAMALMGWSQSSLVKRYQHVVDEMKASAVKKVGDLLWPAATDPTPPQAPKPDSATTPLPDQGAKIIQFRKKAG